MSILDIVSTETRLDRNKKMLQKTHSAGEKVVIWSDGKMSTVEPKVDAQKDRILAASCASIDPEVVNVFRRQNPAGVMFCAAVASHGLNFPLNFIGEGVKVNAQVLLENAESTGDLLDY